MSYQKFLESKKRRIVFSGLTVNDEDLHKSMFDFQHFIVKRGLYKGKFAVWADCGLGKTLMQLVWGAEVVKHTNKSVLILAPLAVVGQTLQQANDKFKIPLIEYQEEFYSMHELPAGIYISNYEQLDNIDTDSFSGIVLDESSILKNFEGKTKADIIERFKNTPYKLACTATPAPNDAMEICNHAEFLDVMSRNEMLAMYFVHDGGETAKWRLKGHSKQAYYDFLNEWAIMLTRPHDIGFKAPGYDLPPLNIIERHITTEKRDNYSLFNHVSVSATEFNAELRLTKVERINEVAGIVNNSTERFLIWVKHNDEADVLKIMIPDAVEVRGSHTQEYKKSKLLGFANNEFRVLITKAKIAQFGMNYQNCHNTVFASPDFSFESMYQSIKRFLRFGQEYPVNAYIVTTDTMSNVIRSFKEKQSQFEEMQKEMAAAMNRNLLNESVQSYTRVFKDHKTENAHIQLGDCVELIKSVPDNSIGLSIFSPPFAELYTYSSELEDMGNSKDYKEFFTAFNYLVKELYRVLWSGRNVVVHCMDLPIQKGKEGYIGLRDFSGMILNAFSDAGFIYHSRVTIWKDPVVEMQRTKALGLLHKQIKKDAAMSRVGIPDYLLVFRKPGQHDNPVKCNISVDTWQKYASPIWYDIDYGDTLNYTSARAEKDERHIAPLQLPTIERSTILWSNEGDTVITPFAGIGSELVKAIELGRKAIGFELKESYFNTAVSNINEAEHKLKLPRLFDLTA